MDATPAANRPASRAGLFALLFKLGPKLLSLLLKLAKGLKVGKFALAGASFATYALLWSWQFAVVFIASLVFHEMGHMWAMRRYGMKTRGIYLIPLLGAAAVAEDRFPSRKAETVIALMGPVWGFGMALASFGAYEATGQPLFAALAGWMAMLNLFNLLPINPLDGGRVMKSVAYSVSSRLGTVFLWLGIGLAFWMAWRFGLALLWLLMIAGALELVGEGRRIKTVRDRQAVLTALAAALGVEATAEAIIDRIRMVHRHLAAGITGTFPPRLLDENPYTGSFSPREWCGYFEARVEGAANRARIARRRWFSGETWYATGTERLTVMRWHDPATASDDESDDAPLFAFLRDARDGMPSMAPKEAVVGFLAYAGLAAALAALMFAASHVPAAQAALQVFMD